MFWRSSTWRRSALLWVAAVCVGALAAALGMRAFARDTVSLGPFTVDVTSGLGNGETVVALPPLGLVQLDTHDAPLGLRATLTGVDVERLAADLEAKSTGEIAEDVQDDARSRLGPFALRTVVIATLSALAGGVLVFRRRWRPVAVATGTALVLVGGGFALTASTYRNDAFAEPRFVGTLRLAPQLLGPARDVGERLDEFRANVERIVGGAIDAYSTLQPQAIGGGDELRVLHVSDIHLNTLGMDFAVEVARGFDVAAIVDTGDLTSYGTKLEEAIVDEIPRFRRPYVFVRGNHDPPSVGKGVEETKNGRTLEGRAKDVAGLRFFGMPHPVFTEDQQEDIDSDAVAEGARASNDALLNAVEAQDDPVDVVAVHDDRMAEALAGHVPLVLSGHFHRARAMTVDGTLYLRAGSTGGAGANMFGGEAPVPFSAEVLYFKRGRRPKLIAYDLIEQSPTTGRLTIQRHLVSEAEAAPSPTATDLRPSPS